MVDIVLPFYIREGPAGEGAIKCKNYTLAVPAIAELVVISGGPVFLFKGARAVKDAYAASHGEQDPLFALAATEGLKTEATIEPNVGQITLHSDNESIGYLRLIEKVIPCP